MFTQLDFYSSALTKTYFFSRLFQLSFSSQIQSSRILPLSLRHNVFFSSITGQMSFRNVSPSAIFPPIRLFFFFFFFSFVVRRTARHVVVQSVPIKELSCRFRVSDYPSGERQTLQLSKDRQRDRERAGEAYTYTHTGLRRDHFAFFLSLFVTCCLGRC